MFSPYLSLPMLYSFYKLDFVILQWYFHLITGILSSAMGRMGTMMPPFQQAFELQSCSSFSAFEITSVHQWDDSDHHPMALEEHPFSESAALDCSVQHGAIAFLTSISCPLAFHSLAMSQIAAIHSQMR